VAANSKVTPISFTVPGLSDADARSVVRLLQDRLN
jgi:hypothetical protein